MTSINVGRISVIDAEHGTTHAHTIFPDLPIGEYDLIAVPRTGGPAYSGSDWRDATIHRLREERNMFRRRVAGIQ